MFSAVTAFLSGDGDRSFRARLGGLADLFLLIRGNVLADRRGVAVDFTEYERLRSDHGAQGVSLAALRIDANLHGVSP
jgi:hypothetical protein